MRVRFNVKVVVGMAIFLCLASFSQADFQPWEPLQDDSWIAFSPTDAKLKMHTVNGGDYEVGFDQAASGNKARGMNALKFSYGGTSDGHMVADTLTGTFAVQNTGDNRTFSDLLILVAINSSSLPGGFAMSLGTSGEAAYNFDPAADFGFYSHFDWDTGRPSGYYSLTSPAGETLAYSFSSGMVTVYAAQGADLAPNGGSVSFDYAFSNLPGVAVFSVYGYDADVGWVYHTNRAVLDANNSSKPVSTFEVAPEPATLALVVFGTLAFARRLRCPGGQ